MIYWTYLDYVSLAGVNLIAKWRNKYLSVDEQAEMDTLLATMAKQKLWIIEKDYKSLSGKYAGIGEIRWWGDQRVPQRVAGIQSADAGTFTLLIGFSHKGNVYTPPGALDTALDRRRHLRLGTGSTCEHEI